MQLDADWLTRQGEDATLLFAADACWAGTRPPSVGVAVSGGGDSMALLHLFRRIAQQTGQVLRAVTVDHQLRDGSAQEAAQVADWCDTLGVPHETLVWRGWDGEGNLQAEARAARYRLIADWAKFHGLDAVALGHTADDIAETFLMRLSRKAGLEGLAAMRARFQRHEVQWVRPLWQQSRADLRDYLRRNDQDWVDDPSNDDPRFDRVRARKALEALAPLGIDTDTLVHTAFSLQIANAALQQQMHAIASEEINEDRGDLLISHSTPLPEEIRRRLLNRAFQWISAEPYPPRWSALIDLEVEVTAGQTRSLSGCLVTRQDTDWRICREFNAVRDTVGATQDVWDNRWQLTGPHAPDLQIRALGESVNSCPNWRETGLPRASLRASPAVFRGETLIAAPLAGYNPDWSAKIVASFTTYLLSH